MVTVCPPRDSNTALYHDLAKYSNQSLSDDHRQSLKEAAYKIFMEASHKEYVKKILATPKSTDMDQVYQVFVSKHLKGHLAPRVSDVTFLDQRVIPGSL